jgi:hypothetical protein
MTPAILLLRIEERRVNMLAHLRPPGGTCHFGHETGSLRLVQYLVEVSLFAKWAILARFPGAFWDIWPDAAFRAAIYAAMEPQTPNGIEGANTAITARLVVSEIRWLECTTDCCREFVS